MKKPTLVQLQSIPALANSRWAYIRDKTGQFIVQAYIGGRGRKREFYGHQFRVNFNNQTLEPIV